MQRFFSLMACLALACTVSLSATGISNSVVLNNANDVQSFGVVSPLLALALMQDDVKCPDNAEINKIEVESGTFPCCDHKERFNATAQMLYDALAKINEICREQDCRNNAIIRICVNYKNVTDEKCIAKATIWYSCCCCISKATVDGCFCDEEPCSDIDIQKVGDRQRYKCCDQASRWDAIKSTLWATWEKSQAVCEEFGCDTIEVRCVQIDFSQLDDETCLVSTSTKFSCCCKCP